MLHGVWIRNGLVHDAREVVDLAVAAEDAGWDGVFLSDAVMEDHTEPFTLLAAVAARTERITLGTWVTPLLARDVVHLARAVALVDQLSDGRVLVGVGLGNQVEHDGLGVPRDALAEDHDAALALFDRLLRGEEVTVVDDGRRRLTGVRLSERPARQPRPPVLLAATWPAVAPLHRAAAWDGVMPYWPGLGEGADDGVAPGANEQELRALVGTYRDAGGDGAILVPRLARLGAAYDQLCAELGVAWQLSCDVMDLAGVAAGPPV